MPNTETLCGVTFSGKNMTSTVGAAQIAPPAGPCIWVPISFLRSGFNGSVITAVCHCSLPVARSSAASDPRKLQQG